jgi:hypothetical protein
MDWHSEGLRIAAPRRVMVAPGMKVPVCAVAQFKSDRPDLPPHPWEVTTVVVSEGSRAWLRTGPVSGTRITPAPIPAVPDTGPTPAGPNDLELSGGTITKYANFDLCASVPLPPESATYDVFITYGAFRSNSVRIELVAP